MAGMNFDEQSVRRIVRSVLRSEKEEQNPVFNPRTFNRRSISGEEYRLIRGQSVGIQSGNVVVVDNVIVLAGGLDPTNGDPTGTVGVVNLTFSPTGAPRTYESGHWINAVYSPDAGSGGYGGDVGTAYRWETLETGSGGGGDAGAPLRRFQLSQTKEVGDTTAQAVWLDHNGDLNEEAEFTLHDPDGWFYGRITGWLSYSSESGTAQERGFRGLAALRPDNVSGTAVPGTDRWEIVAMEGFPQFIEAEIVEIPSGEDAGWYLKFVDAAHVGHMAMGSRRPYKPYTVASIPEDAITVLTGDPVYGDTATALELIGEGETVLLMLDDPDTTAPTYRICEVKDTYKLKVNSLDTTPAYLQDSLSNMLTYDSDLHQHVYGAPIDAGGGDYRMNLFTAKGTGGGTGGYCIAKTGTGLEFDAITTQAGQRAVDIDTTKQQFMVHFGDAAARTDAKWKTGSGYQTGTTQYLENETGTWQWINRLDLLKPRHGADGSIVINSVKGVEVLISGGTLTVNVGYTAYLVYGVESTTGTFTASRLIYNETEVDTGTASVITDVACVDDSLSVTDDIISIPSVPSPILTPP